jgi:hypothetical protein
MSTAANITTGATESAREPLDPTGPANDNGAGERPRALIVLGDLRLEARKREVGELLARILVRQALREAGLISGGAQ